MSRSRVADVWPLSPLQEGLLFHALYDQQGPDLYQGQHAFDLAGPLDPARLRASAQALLDRHASLRAAFQQPAGAAQPVQVVLRGVAVPWRDEDVSGPGAAAAWAEAERLAAADRAERFDLRAAPLLRFLLIRLGARQHRLVITSHHIVLDGWSLPVLVRELTAIYAAGGQASGLPAVPPYREYLAWLARQDKDIARAAWRDALAGLTEPTLTAPADPARVPVKPAHADAEAGLPLASALRTQARELGVTVNTVLQGAWGLVLARLAGRRDVVFGTTVAGRPPELPGVESMLGLFINKIGRASWRERV